MAEKFQKIVSAPHRFMGHVRKKIAETTPTTRGGKVARGTGLTVAGVFQFLLWTARTAALDNPVLRAAEQKISRLADASTTSRAGRAASWVGRHPNFSAHVLYYAMAMSAIAAATGGESGCSDFRHVDATKTVNAFDNFQVGGHKISDADWARQIAAIHSYVIAHLIFSEEFIARTYYDNQSSGTQTFGIGFTIDDPDHRAFAEKVLGFKIRNGMSVTFDQARAVADAWLHQRIYPKIRANVTAPMDARLFVIMAVAAYNRGQNTFDAGNKGARVTELINRGAPPIEIAAAYVHAFGGIRGTQWGGLPNKYGVCALYYLGEISDDIILSSVAGAPYAIEKKLKKVQKNIDALPPGVNPGRLLVYDGTHARARANGVVRGMDVNKMLMSVDKRHVKGTTQKKVGAYLTMTEVDCIASGRLFDNKTTDYQTAVAKKVDVNESPSMRLNAAGEDLFLAGKYADALRNFNAARIADPTNFIAYSNAAIACYKLGDYAGGLKIVQELIASDYIKKMPVDIRGYTYYNAALCREKLGDNAVDPATRWTHYDMARRNIRIASRASGVDYIEFLTRVTIKMQAQAGKTAAFNHAGKKLSEPDVRLFQMACNAKSME